MRLALYQPDIPQNTGTILRLAACFNVPVDIIGPTGFDMSDRALKRASLDYLDHVDLTRHNSFEAFLTKLQSEQRRLLLATTKGATLHTDMSYTPNDTILLGRESAGAPDTVHKAADERIVIPIRKDLRSLNIAVAAAILLGEALRQTEGFKKETLA